jgi:cytochrome c oxidase cbb3-type subunit 3
MKMKKIYLILLLFPAFILAIGEDLYKQHCEKCHGIKKDGSIGLPLGKEKLALFSDNYLLKTIKLGRPGRVMPTFDLADSDSMRIIEFLRGNTKPASYNQITISGDAENGKKLYEEYCYACHHKPLVGGEGVGKNHSWKKDLKVAPPALANSGFLAAISDAELKTIIKKSFPDSEMPSFNLILTSSEVNDIISYLRSFTGKTPEDREVSEQLSFIFDSPYDLDTTIKKIQDTIKAANFRVYKPRKLLQDLTTSKELYSKQVVIRFCNFEQMLKFLKIEPRLGVVLPCRITIIENNNKEVKVVIENYKKTVAKFNNAQLLNSADELISSLSEIIEEALW